MLFGMMTIQQINRQHLVRLLQRAHSGEMAAAYAYRGHWRSLANAGERATVRFIEEEEWTHRRELARLLGELNAKPSAASEVVMWAIGRLIGLLCRIGGWFIPMYFAGKLESGSSREYELAARYAGELELAPCQATLLAMAAVEREHERYFMQLVSGHWLLPVAQKIMHH